MGAEQVELVHGLQRGLRHADGACVQLPDALVGPIRGEDCDHVTRSPPIAAHLVGLGAALPHPVVWGDVRPLDVEHQVLDEGDLVQAEDDLEAGGGHLGQGQEVEGDSVHLA